MTIAVDSRPRVPLRGGEGAIRRMKSPRSRSSRRRGAARSPRQHVVARLWRGGPRGRQAAGRAGMWGLARWAAGGKIPMLALLHLFPLRKPALHSDPPARTIQGPRGRRSFTGGSLERGRQGCVGREVGG